MVLFQSLPISQERWEESIRSVSGGGFYHFTEAQLFAELLDEKSDSSDLYRLTLVLFLLGQLMLPSLGMATALLISMGLFFLSPAKHKIGICLLFTSVIGLGLGFSVGFWGVLCVPALISATMCLRYEPQQLLSFSDVQDIQKKWFQVYPRDRILSEAKLGIRPFVPEGAEDVLLVDREILVDFFVHNGFLVQMQCAVLSTRHLPLIVRTPFKRIFFLHGSGAHISSVTSALSVIDIGWTERELITHPSFHEFLQKDQLPVDLLSPKELMESTEFAIRNQVGILHFFES